MAGANKSLVLAPSLASHDELVEALHHCHNCDLYKDATQAVPGRGPLHPAMMMIGEQPGDEEDLKGLPFVGPAGRLLDDALRSAAIDRSEVYVTNAVKHFKWTPRGKRRLHQKPRDGEVRACQPWLLAEIALIGPGLLVFLGATAAQSLMGKDFRVTQQRGVPLQTQVGPAVATVHPSSILRAPDEQMRQAQMQLFVADLITARRMAEQHKQRSALP